MSFVGISSNFSSLACKKSKGFFERVLVKKFTEGAVLDQ
jgi:hypothetical protein